MRPSSEAHFAIGDFVTDAGHVRLALNTAGDFSLLTESAATRMKLATAAPAPDAPPFYRTRKLVAATRDFGPSEFAIVSARLPHGIDGMLGRPFFEQHLVCLDYARREIRIRRRRPPNSKQS